MRIYSFAHTVARKMVGLEPAASVKPDYASDIALQFFLFCTNSRTPFLDTSTWALHVFTFSSSDFSATRAVKYSWTPSSWRIICGDVMRKTWAAERGNCATSEDMAQRKIETPRRTAVKRPLENGNIPLSSNCRFRTIQSKCIMFLLHSIPFVLKNNKGLANRSRVNKIEN